MTEISYSLGNPAICVHVCVAVTNVAVMSRVLMQTNKLTIL